MVEATKEAAKEKAVVCQDYNCANCKNLSQCKHDTAELLKEVQEELSKSPNDEKLKEKAKKAKSALITDENAANEVCSDFAPNGRLPKEVESAIALIASMPVGSMNLFQWQMDNLSEKRKLEEDLGVKIGEPYYSASGKEMGVVVDLAKGKIRVRKANGKYIVVKVSVTEEEEYDE